MPGPLPSSTRRRRNEPTIPTTILPLEGRQGPIPRTPKWVHLGKAGKAWWRWAWRTPQAAAWAPGHEAAIARRATLEDDLEALAQIDGAVNMAELLGISDRKDLSDQLNFLLGAIKRQAAGKLAIEKAMLELDDRLGLTPKAMAALRWTIGTPKKSEADAADAPPPPEVSDLEERRRRVASGAS